MYRLGVRKILYLRSMLNKEEFGEEMLFGEVD